MKGRSTRWNHGKHFVFIMTRTGGIFQEMLTYSWCICYSLVIRENSFVRVWWGQTVLPLSSLSDLFRHMLLDAVEKALGRTTHIPTLTVAYEFVDQLAFKMSKKYVVLNSGQQRSSGENHFRFHRGVAALYRKDFNCIDISWQETHEKAFELFYLAYYEYSIKGSLFVFVLGQLRSAPLK